MLVIKLILNLKISGLERKAIEGNLALKGLNQTRGALPHFHLPLPQIQIKPSAFM